MKKTYTCATDAEATMADVARTKLCSESTTCMANYDINANAVRQSKGQRHFLRVCLVSCL